VRASAVIVRIRAVEVDWQQWHYVAAFKERPVSPEQSASGDATPHRKLVLAESVAIGLWQHHCGREKCKTAQQAISAGHRCGRRSTNSIRKWPGGAAAAAASPQRRN